MTEQPSVQEQIAFNDMWNSTWRCGPFEQMNPDAKARGEAVIERVRSLSLDQPRILEAGCGNGWLTEKLAELGSATGVDLSPRAIEIAKERGTQAEFFAANLYEHELPREYFDVVVLNEVISTVPDQPRFISILSSALKPGGHLILTSQNKFIYKRRLDVGPPKPGNIRKWLSRRELRRLLAPEFTIRTMRTIRPKAEGRGLVLRIANSYKVNHFLGRSCSPARIDRIKESLGLGQTWVILAQRRRARG